MLRKVRVRTNPRSRFTPYFQKFRSDLNQATSDRDRALEMSREAHARAQAAESRGLLQEGWRRLKLRVKRMFLKPRQS